MDDIKYLAHINDRKEEQLLKDHLEGTAQRSGAFAEAFGMYDWGYGCGLLHDIGKYTKGAVYFPTDNHERISPQSMKTGYRTSATKWYTKGAE